MKIAFLLGAGSSTPLIPEGSPLTRFPSTRLITESILSGVGITRTEQSRYVYAPHKYEGISGREKRLIARNTAIIDHARGKIKDSRLVHSKDEVSYEDIAYYLLQLRDALSGEYDNPVLERTVDDFHRSLRDIYYEEASLQGRLAQRLGLDSNEVLDRELASMLDDVCHYMEDVVCEMLTSQVPSPPLEHLRFLSEAVARCAPREIGIITLNHDSNIERFLESNSIPFVDGIDPIGNCFGWRQFAQEEMLGLFKLHGSVDWYYVPDRRRIERTSWNSLDAIISPHAAILLGRHNKMLEYTRGIFASLFVESVMLLDRSEILVVCGYGFGDKAVNSLIIDWMTDRSENKLVIVHPEPETLPLTSRGAIANVWNRWVKSNQLRFIKQALSVDNPLTFSQIQESIA